VTDAPDAARAVGLRVICGCMFSGKTTRLIATVAAARAAGQRVQSCKHAVDDRYDPQQLVTHDRQAAPAVALADARALLAEAAGFDLVAIDEGHFFGRALVDVVLKLRARDCAVVVAGLDHDAWGQAFPGMAALKARADVVDRLHVPCVLCGRPARFSQRLVPVDRVDMVGGPAEYSPRCAACFEPLASPPPRY
jgi:thymidine kinase